MSRESNERASLLALPMELHLRIRNEVLLDPDMVMADYKPLRLVCKIFNDIWSPIVLHSIVLFPNRYCRKENVALRAGFQQLVDLAHGHDRWRYTETVTMDTWDWMESDPPIQYILKSWSATYKLQVAFTRAQVKSHFAQLPKKHSLVNVRCVRWHAYAEKKHWLISRTVKLFMSLPNLTELELTITHEKHNTNSHYFATQLAQLRNLRKLSLYVICATFRYPHSGVLDPFRKVIASNLKLTHLYLGGCRDYDHPSGDFSLLMGDVPADHPLKLEHLCLYSNLINPDSLLPHIRSLKSLSRQRAVDFSGCNVWPTLCKAKIFPAAVVGSATDDFTEYLRAHAGVVSLSFYPGRYSKDSNWFVKDLARHANTLEVFGMGLTHYCYINGGSQLVFAQLSNLKRMVVYCDSWYKNCGLQVPSDICGVLRTTAQVHHQVVVVFDSKDVFKECVAHCCASQDVLLHSLARRMVYEVDAKQRSIEWVQGGAGTHTRLSETPFCTVTEGTQSSKRPVCPMVCSCRKALANFSRSENIGVFAKPHRVGAYDNPNRSFDYFATHLAQLHNLRKLSLHLRCVTPRCFGTQTLALNPFRKVIFSGDLSPLMEDVLVNHPLKLEHLYLYPDLINLERLLPHIRSLKFLRLYEGSNWFMRDLARHANTLEVLGMGLTYYCYMNDETK
ncbi:hypothetical protein AX17_006911 [Amanita inopinata Kibby_2008]|nr:hypothetical protein AX17_006911 [Amanita inopinata Kibby_2008]